MAGIEINAVGLESMITMSPHLPYYDGSVNLANATLENTLIYNLARNIDVSAILYSMTENDTLSFNGYSDTSGNEFYAEEIMSSVREKFDIITSSELNDGNFALASQYVESGVVNYDASSYLVGNAIYKDIKVIKPTESIYESNFSITTSNNNGPFYSKPDSIQISNTDFSQYNADYDPLYKAEFDGTNPNSNIIRALNSQFSTTNNTNLMTVEEDYVFNQQHSMGSDLGSYFTIDPSNGHPIVNSIDPSHTILTNGIVITDAFTYCTDLNNTPGTYKITRQANNVNVALRVDGSNIPHRSANEISKLNNSGLFNSSTDSQLLLDFSINTFYSLFNRSEETISEGYNFVIDISSADNSGYQKQTETDIFTLDSTNITDNHIYMGNYVSGTHALSFSDASLSVVGVSNATTNNNSLFTLSGEREVLSNGELVNGEIKLNINSPTTRSNTLQNDGNSLVANVYYNEEGASGITSEVRENPYVKYSNELVFKHPSYDVNYSLSNGSTLNFYDGLSLINGYFAQGDVQFNSLTSAPENSLEIFKISGDQNYFIKNSLFDLSGNAFLGFTTDDFVIQNLNILPTEENSLNRIQLSMNLRNITDLSINTALVNGGWSLANVNSKNLQSYTYLTTDYAILNAEAISLTTTATIDNLLGLTNSSSQQSRIQKWPYQEDIVDILNNEVASIYYKIKFVYTGGYTSLTANSNQVTSNYGGYLIWNRLENKVNLTDSSANLIYFSYDKITQVVLDSSSTTITIDPSEYTVLNNLNSGHVSIKKTTKIIRQKLKFNLNLRPYDYLTASTPEFITQEVYYSIQDTLQDGEVFIGADHLVDISFANGRSKDYTTTIVSGDLVFNSSLTANDFKELSVVVNALNDDDSITPITQAYNTSVYFGIPLTMEFLNNYEASPMTGDITFSFNNYVGSLNSSNGYVANFYKDGNSNYSLQYFTTSYANISTIGGMSNSTNVLSVSNGYSNITNWDSSSYNLQVSLSNDKSTTTLTAKDSENTTAFTLTIPDFKYFNTTAFITRANTDVFRFQRYIGDSSSNNNFTETFVGVDYTNNTINQDSGVYITGVAGLDYNTLSLGNKFTFELLKDSISVNLVGSATTPSPITSFLYQYTNGSHSSQSLSLDRYRGFYGAQSVNQVYELRRNPLYAVFTVNNDGLVASQIFTNIYPNKVVSVNNLLDSNSNSIGGLGLGITFSYSMLNITESRSFNISLIPDDVTITVKNSYSAMQNTINTHLSSYLLYLFSGSNFNSTGNPFKINSSRIKLRNSSFNNNRMQYSLYLSSGSINVYRIPQYLGNPLSSSGYGDSIADITIESLAASNLNGDIYNDGNGYLFNLSLNPAVIGSESTSYFVIPPPYYKFTQRGNFGRVNSLPYNPSVNAATDNVISYVPVNMGNIYYPFAPSTTYVKSDGNSINIQYNQTNVNNVKITNLKPPSQEHSSDYTVNFYYGHDYPSHDLQTPRKIYIEGNNYTINYNLGLNSVNTNISTLFNGTGNSLFDLSDNNADLVVTSINNGSGAILSYRQNWPNLSNGSIGTDQIFGVITDFESIPQNITLEIDSFFFSGLNNAVFNLPLLKGVNLSVYTKQLKVDTLGNAKIYVYKYPALSSIDVSSISQSNTFLYNQRYVKVIPVPPIVIGSSVVKWDNLIKSISKSAFAGNWSLDTSFNTNMFVNVAMLTDDSLPLIKSLLYASDINGLTKVTYINKRPILQLLNKLGMPILEIDSVGGIKTPIVSTPLLQLNPVVDSAVNNTLSNYPLLSVLRYMLNPNA